MRVAQQAAVAALGQGALGAHDLQSVFDDAVTSVAETLGVEYCSILELQSDGSELRAVASAGWPPEFL